MKIASIINILAIFGILCVIGNLGATISSWQYWVTVLLVIILNVSSKRELKN